MPLVELGRKAPAFSLPDQDDNELNVAPLADLERR